MNATMDPATETYTVALAEDAQVPMTREQIRAACAAGTLAGGTLLWRAGLEQWSTVETLAAELGLEVATPTAEPPEHLSDHTMDALAAAFGMTVARPPELRPAPLPPARRPLSLRFYVGVLLLALAFAASGFFVSYWRARPETVRAARADEVRALARQAVLDRLKAPDSAKLTFGEIDLSKPGDETIAGFVDAQNSFGAMLRSTWVVELKEGKVLHVNFLDHP